MVNKLHSLYPLPQNQLAFKLDRLLQGYQMYARTEARSPHTIGIFTTALESLFRFLETRGLPTGVTEIGVPELREYILYLQQARKYERHPFTGPQATGLSLYTINGYLRAIRAFWSWLLREEIVAVNPFSRIRIPKPPKKVIATFSTEQLLAILKRIDTNDPIGFRDWLIILTLMDTGLRARS